MFNFKRPQARIFFCAVLGTVDNDKYNLTPNARAK